MIENEKQSQSLEGFIPQEFKAIRVTFDSDGEQVVPRRYKGRKGEALAALQSVEGDISRVRSCCSLFLTSDDLNIRRMAFDSALIRYRRCFSGGVRWKLSRSDVLALDGVDAALHDYFITKADKYVAHSVNGLDYPIALVIPGDVDEPTRGHAICLFDVGLDSPDRIRAFDQLLESIQKNILETTRRKLEIEFENEVKALTYDDVEKLKKINVPTNLSTEMLKKRRI